MPASLKADLRERIAAIEEMFAEIAEGDGQPVARPRRRHAAHVQRAGREDAAPFRHPVVGVSQGRLRLPRA